MSISKNTIAKTSQQTITLTVEQSFRQAVAHHQAGQLQDAERLYRAILEVQPGHPDANHKLGVLAVQVKQPVGGLLHFKAALEADPSQGQYWLSYIDALIQTGRTDAARQVLAQGRQRGLQGDEVDALAERLTNDIPDPDEITMLPVLFNEGRYAEAEILARSMTERFPLNGFGWKALGAVFMQMGQSKASLLPLQNAAALLPGDAEAYYNLGNALQDLQRLDDAVASYRRALEINPDYAEAHSNLGVAQHALGQTDDAVTSYRRALEIMPHYAEAHSNLGNVLRDLGQLDEAVASCRRALEIRPDYAEAHINLGNALRALGQAEESVSSCRRALEIRPDYAEAHCNLGNALQALGQPDDAVASYRRALVIKPDYAEAHINLGAALHDLGQPDDAMACYHRALAINPDHAKAHNNLGAALQGLGQLDGAVASYRRAVELEPDYAEAHSNLGNTLRDLMQPQKAVACYRCALEIKPDFAEAHSNLGASLQDLGQLEEALASYRRALETKPDYADAHSNLGNALHDLGQFDDAVASYRQALEIKPDHAEAHSNLLLSLNYHFRMSVSDVFAEHRRWDEMQTGACARIARLADERNPQRRLRIGYVSPDLRQHSVAYFLEPLLREHDHQAVEVFCYADVMRPDTMTSHLQALSDCWLRTVGLSDEALAHQIVDDRIDILVDLAGHTGHNRLLVFARKPAPVQVTWLGYPNTTGLSAMDYRLVDSVTDPEGEADALACETLVRLEKGFLCYSPPPDAPPPAALPSLTSGSITFGSFNNPSKLSSDTLDAWATLLCRVPGSRLLCKGKPFADAGSKTHFLTQLERRGVDPQRVNLLGWLSGQADHLTVYQQVDIALDPFPYNGTTTTCEALWMGVPVITLLGDRHAGRVSASLLTQIGLTELIADSVQAYVDVAAALANDAQRLSELRRTLRARIQASSLCDAPAFARKIEAAYRNMWQLYCENTSQATLTLFNGVRNSIADNDPSPSCRS